MTPRSLLVLALLTSATAGCPGKEDGDASTGTTGGPATASEPTTGASSSTGPDTSGPSCACIDPEAHGVGSYSCSHDGGCDDVVAFCDVEVGMDTPACGDRGKFSVDEVALDCAIDQLIAGTPGLVWWKIDSNGPETSGAWVDLGEGRKGVGRAWDFLDLGGTDYDAGTLEIKDAAYFEGCKTKPDVEAKFLCFKAWHKTQPDASCDAEASYSDPF